LAVIYVAPPLFMPRVYLITTTPTDALLPMVRPPFRRLQREPGERLDCWRFRSQKLPVCSYAHARQSWQNRHHPHRRERRRDLMQASIGSQSRRHHTVSWHRSWSKQRQAGHPREQAQSLHRAQLQFRADAVARRRSPRMNASSQPSRWATTSTPRNLSVPGVPAGANTTKRWFRTSFPSKHGHILEIAPPNLSQSLQRRKFVNETGGEHYRPCRDRYIQSKDIKQSI